MIQSGLAKSFRAYMRQQQIAESGEETDAENTDANGSSSTTAFGSDSQTPAHDARSESGTQRDARGRVLRYVYPEYFGADARAQIPLFEDETGITIVDEQTPAHATGTRRAYAEMFDDRPAGFDVGHMDVIWPGLFANNGWTTPIDDRENHTDAMLDAQVETLTVAGDLQAMPIHTDANVLFYRADKLREYGYETPPSTETELVTIARDILDRDDDIDHGYIWQGGLNEGLTIMWLNWLWGRDGTIEHGDDIVVKTSKGVDALAHAVDLIHEHGVTPAFVAESSTDENRRTFQQGNTLFMRNWPYAVALLDEGTPVAGEFEVTTLPTHEAHPDAANSCLGGWSLFITAQADNEPEAQAFIDWMASKDVQRRLAIDHSRLPARKDLYEDDRVRTEFERLDVFERALEKTRSRPSIAAYPRLSEIIFTECNAALKQKKTPAEALADAQSRIDEQIN